ncbi:hypothetical protein ACWCXX_33850 [Streptomyces sp. NPDC001732]
MAGKDDPRRAVDAHGAKGLMVGDSNLQVNMYASVRPTARSAYHYQIRAIAPEVLVGRETELADLASFCTDPESGDYLWLRAEPWAGKTALMSWFVLHPPPEVRIVSFFITARLAAQSDREAFLDVVIEQLASVLGEPVPAYLTDATRASHLWEMLDLAAASCVDQGQRLVLIVDGLDEDTGSAAHSVAALLPPSPAAGMRVMVAGRHDPPVPSDVPSRHPLRDRANVRFLEPSPYAQDVRRDAEHELKRLLRGTPVEQDLLGLVTAAGGGLSSRDLEELTGRQAWEVEESLHTVAGRTFARRPEPSTQGEVYVLGHEELQQSAVRFLGDARLSGYRQRLHSWAEGYRVDRWPTNTPGYLLRGYFPMLHAGRDLARMTACALDSIRHNRMLDVSGGDVAALAEITATQDMLLEGDPSDVRIMTLLSVRRDSLIERNSRIPVGLPAVWALLGHHVRAQALVRSIADPLKQVQAMAALSDALVECEENSQHQNLAGDTVHAGDVVHEAEAVARGITLPYEKKQALASVAKAAARAGDLEQGVVVARAISDPLMQAEVLRGVAEAGALAGNIGDAAAIALGITGRRQPKPAPHQQPDRTRREQHEWVLQVQQEWALRDVAKAAARAGDLEQGVVVARAISDPLMQAEVLRGVAEAGALAGNIGDAAAIALGITDASQRVRALAGMARTSAQTGDFSRARDFASHAAVVARTMTERRGQATALAVAARAKGWAGDLSHAADLARAVFDPHEQARALAAVAEAMAQSGDLDQAGTLAHEAETAAQAVNDADQQAWVLATVVKAAAPAGDIAYTGHLVRRAWALAQTINDNPEWQATILAAVVAAGQGRDAGQALALVRTMSDPLEQFPILAEAAKILTQAGDLERAEALVRAITDPETQAQTMTLLAQAMARTGDLHHAGGLARDAETAARTLMLTDRMTLTLADVAAAMARTGDLHHAGDLARSAGELARTAVHPRSRAWALARVAEVLAESGFPDRAMDLAIEAETLARTFKDVGNREGVLGKAAKAAARAGYTGHALDIAQTITNKLVKGPVLQSVAAAAARAGDLGQARALARGITDSYDRLAAIAEAAGAAAQAGHVHHTKVLARDARIMARKSNIGSWSATTLQAVATAVAQAGDLDHAQRLARDAAVAARTITDRRDRAQYLAVGAQVAARAGDLDHATNLVREAEAEIRADTNAVMMSRAREEMVRAKAVIGDTADALALARSLHPNLQAEALSYVARHAGTAQARPLIAQALRIASWERSINSLAKVEPSVLKEVADAFLAENGQLQGVRGGAGRSAPPGHSDSEQVM